MKSEIVSIGIHFGHHPPESASLDVNLKTPTGIRVLHLTLLELRALKTELAIGSNGVMVVDVSGDAVIQLVDALVDMAVSAAV